jgi:hypothetical protein
MRGGRYGIVVLLTITAGGACGGMTEGPLQGDDGDAAVRPEAGAEAATSSNGEDLEVEASVEPIEAAVDDEVVQPAADASCCLDPSGQDGQNLQYAPADTCTDSAFASVAWEYVPACDFDATHIELFDASGPVGILGDTGGNPSPNLWTELLPPGSPHAWNGMDIVPPVHLVGGQTYFIYEGSPACSIATAGATQTFWLYDPQQGRLGPYNKYAFTFRISGTCP